MPRFLITCPKGLEELLSQEAIQLGLSTKLTVGGIFAELPDGEFYSIYKFCLYSRFANRVIWLISEFQCLDNEMLFQNVYSTPWLQHFSVDNTISVDFRGTNQFINNTNYGAMLVKDAVVDHFVHRSDERPNVNTKDPDIRIFFQLGRKTATLGIDISGGSLHKRGYRLQAAKAPLKENLAAALCARARQFAPEGQWLDPFCGSGTLLIEGVLADLGIASQFERQYFGFENLKKHNVELFDTLMNEAIQHKEAVIDKAVKDLAESGQSALAYGFDVDAGVLKAARGNIERAGLSDLIKVETRSLENFERPDMDQALLVMNPPYGERLDDRDQLMSLYANVGHVLKQQCQGDRAAILSSDDFLLKNLGLQKAKRYKLFNGKLPVEWLLFNLYKKEKPAVLPAQVSENYAAAAAEATFDEKELQLVEMVANRLRKNCKKLRKWSNKNNISCYRVYDADMPEYAFAIDNYDDRIQVTEYAAPKQIDEFAAFKRRRQFLKAVEQVFDLTESELFIKQRKQQKGNSQYERVSDDGHNFWVKEGDAEFQVNLTDYLDTGLFLDHRPIRLEIAKIAKGKRFLNLFSYTSTASVHAALGGAVASDSVDMSQTYINWSESNFTLNRLDKTKHRLHRANVLEWVDNNKLSYDLIFLDPPSFSNSKRMENTWDVQRDHEALIEKLMTQLEPDGHLIFSNNLRKFKISTKLKEQFKVDNISQRTIDLDFERKQHIHQCWSISHK